MQTGDTEHVLDNGWDLRETQPSPLHHLRDLTPLRNSLSLITGLSPLLPSSFYLPPSPSHVPLLPLLFYSSCVINWRVVGVILCSFLNPNKAHISPQYCLSLQKRQSTIKGVSQ